jgi:small subunit ribosomal protein S8
MSDSIADMITRIRNGQSSKLLAITFPYSKLKCSVLNVLRNEGYIESFEVLDENPKKKMISARLKYTKHGEPCVQEIAKISKPGCRIYTPISTLGNYKNGMGIYVISTPKGVVSDKQARKLNAGGELLCKVF